tara:strand:+ start:3434 stop:4390 length:957 start_codon:yes stop_codon:yes gene_type:complete
MKKFLKNICLGLIPLGIYVFLIISVDPYNYFNDSFKTKNKSKISETNNKALNQILGLKNVEFEKIIVGDSRVGALNKDYILENYQLDFKKIVIPAAKLNEINDLVHFMVSNQSINEIIIGMNFNMFNDFAFSTRADEILKIYEKPLFYIFNFNIFKLSIKILNNHLFKLDIADSKPTISKDEFWQQHLNTRSKWQYSRFKYPIDYAEKIKELDDYCLENNIKFTVILFPHHYDDIKVLKSYNLIEDKKRFYALMKELNGLVINYDYYHERILNSNNFDDPVHFNDEIGKIIVDEVFSNALQWGISNKDENFTKMIYDN